MRLIALKITLVIACTLSSYAFGQKNEFIRDSDIQAAKSAQKARDICIKYTGFDKLTGLRERDFVEPEIVHYGDNHVPMIGYMALGRAIWICKYQNVCIPNALKGMVRDYEVAIDSASGRLLWIYSSPKCDEGVDTLPMPPIGDIDDYIRSKNIVFQGTPDDITMNLIEALSIYPGNRWNTCEMYAYFVKASTPTKKETSPQ